MFLLPSNIFSDGLYNFWSVSLSLIINIVTTILCCLTRNDDVAHINYRVVLSLCLWHERNSSLFIFKQSLLYRAVFSTTVCCHIKRENVLIQRVLDLDSFWCLWTNWKGQEVCIKTCFWTGLTNCIITSPHWPIVDIPFTVDKLPFADFFSLFIY